MSADLEITARSEPQTRLLDFLRYLHTHEHELESRIVGIETVAHVRLAVNPCVASDYPHKQK